MATPTLLVYLKSATIPFNISDRLLDCMRGDLPGVRVENLETRDELEGRLGEAQVVLTWCFEPHWYDRAPGLAAVCTPAAGTDWAPPDPSGRVPTIYGKFHGRMMGESLLGMILFFNHRLDVMVECRRRKVWDRNAQAHTRLLRNQRVVFLGYGTIGRYCARMLKPFGPQMRGMQRSRAGGEDEETGVVYFTEAVLEEVLSEADHVVSILPGGAGTDGLLSRDRLAAIKRGAFFYNIGRGNCCSEDDLIWALDGGVLGGAALDVFAQEPLPTGSPLWERDNVLLTPHSTCIYQDYLDIYYEELRGTLRELFGLTGGHAS